MIFDCNDLEKAGLFDTKQCCVSCHEDDPAYMCWKFGPQDLEAELCCQAIKTSVVEADWYKMRSNREEVS